MMAELAEMAEIVLTAGVRANLLQMQRAADLITATQTKLATGRRINSALDNPVNFFTAQSLRSRTGDLAALTDGIATTRQTLNAAANGIQAVLKLVQAAKSVVEQARMPQQTAGGYGAASFAGTANITPAPATSIVNTGTNPTYNINGLAISVGGISYTVTQPPGAFTVDENVIAINNTAGLGAMGAATASKDGSGNLVLTSNSAAPITVVQSAAAFNAGLINPNLVQVVAGLDGTEMTVQVRDDAELTIAFGNGPGEVSTFSELNAALASAGAFGMMVGNPPRLEIATDAGDNAQNVLTLGGSALAPLGIAGGTQFGGVAGTASSAREVLAQQYERILQQIDRLAGDASFNGRNLLAGGTLNLTLNETGTATASIQGFDGSAAGIGLLADSNRLQTVADVDRVVMDLDAATVTLRSHAQVFGSALSVMEVREAFTKSMINALQTGSDGLTLADQDAEGAHLLALQTRQQLSSTALSLASQASQAVLQLFR
jgi:flagellin